MSDAVKDERPARPQRERARSAEAQKPGGNPDTKPSPNAGNVGLGAPAEGQA